MGAFRLWPSSSIIASGLVPDTILISLCEAVEAGRHNHAFDSVPMTAVDVVTYNGTRIYLE